MFFLQKNRKLSKIYPKHRIEYVFTNDKIRIVMELTQVLTILAMATNQGSSIPVLYLAIQGLHAVPAFLHFYMRFTVEQNLNT